jgi:hypothetical protein
MQVSKCYSSELSVCHCSQGKVEAETMYSGVLTWKTMSSFPQVGTEIQWWLSFQGSLPLCYLNTIWSLL